MATDKKDKKNIFQKIFTSKEKKEAEAAAVKAAEEAKLKAVKEAEEARQKALAEKAALEKAAQEKAEAAKKQAEEAKKAADEALQKKILAEAEARKQAYEETAAKAKAEADAAAAAAAAVLAKYTIKSEDTLSGIAQKHYGHSTREYWNIIYEANKEAIGDNPGLIKPGVELTIPKLPDELKDK